jgi:PUA domain protein
LVAKRRFLSKKEVKQLLEAIEAKLGLTDLPREGYEEVEDEDAKLILLNREPFLVILEDGLALPHLKYLLKHGHCFLPKIVVDKGAVKPIGSGADVMAPGIVRIDGSFKENDIAVVTEERMIPIAVVKAIYPSEAVASMKKGKVALNLHYPGDKYWKLSEKL